MRLFINAQSASTNLLRFALKLSDIFKDGKYNAAVFSFGADYISFCESFYKLKPKSACECDSNETTNRGNK